jgi:hypothetical protein
MRDSQPSNRAFASDAEILDPCCHAWNRLFDQPWQIVELRDWRTGFD